MANPQVEGNAWYVPFPRGYWLYEKSKHLWVSGYPIKAKLFKTPQEFALHLIWLLSSSADYRDCCCVHCNLPSLPRQSSSTGEDTPTLSARDPPIKPELQAQVQAKQHQTSNSPVPLPATVAQRMQSRSQQASASPAPAQQQQQQQPPLPSVTWALKSPLLYRVGELIWYHNGTSWRLGVIAAQGQPQGQSQGQVKHEVIPVGHAMVPQRHVAKAPNEMHPFHAFSVPPLAIPDLKDKVFDQVPWEATFQANATLAEGGAGGNNNSNNRDLLLVDASKMAANKVDHSYSLWSPVSEDLVGKTTSYYGCFLGAERVEVGDVVRLRSLPPELGVSVAPETPILLGLGAIFISADLPGEVLFRGHAYVLIRAGHPSAASVPAGSPTVAPDNLPIALREEVTWRNSLPDSGGAWSWVMVKDDVVLGENSVRGRFYPTHHLLPILDLARFQHISRTGQIIDDARHAHDQAQAQGVLPQLNSRMDGAGRYIGRRVNRRDTLGASVPQTSHLALEQHITELQ